MATVILKDPTIDEIPFGAAIVEVLRHTQIPMSTEEIQEALKTTDIGGEYYIEATPEEILDTLDWILEDGNAVRLDGERYQATAPSPV